MKSAAKTLCAPSKYNWLFFLFLLSSAGLLPPPNLPHQCVKLRLGYQGISWPCLRHRAAAHHTLWILLSHAAHSLPNRQLQNQPTSLTSVSAFFSLDCQCLILLCLPQYHYLFCLLSGDAWRVRACAVSTVSLLLAPIGTGNMEREDTLEIGRICSLFLPHVEYVAGHSSGKRQQNICSLQYP